MASCYFGILLICGLSAASGMEYLNNGAYKIPSLGLGTFTVTDDIELSHALNVALELGYRHIDTAASYQNEHIIGKVLNEWISSGKVKRDDLFITTKLAYTDLFPERVQQALNSSLEKLQLDYVDLWLIHFPVAVVIEGNRGVAQSTDLVAVWKKMEEQVDMGKTKTIGLSNCNISQIERIQNIAKVTPVNLQVELHLYFQQREIRDFARKNNITVVCYGPLGAPGLNKYLREHNDAQVVLPDILNDEVVKKIAVKHKKTNAQVALRFLIQSNLGAVPKTTNPKRLKENIDIFDFVLDKEDMESLKMLDKGKKSKIYILSNIATEVTKHPEYPFYENLPEDA